MALSANPNLNTFESVLLPPDYLEPRWYVAYTCANHEKTVLDQLERRSVESFLPIYAAIRRWKDRRIRLDLPLFPGYVFVHWALNDRMRVLQTPGVVRLVGFGGQSAALPDGDVAALRQGLSREMCIEPHPYLKVGHRVRVRSGPLQGLEGILVRKKKSAKIVISLDLIIVRSVAAEIDIAELELVDSGRIVAKMCGRTSKLR